MAVRTFAYGSNMYLNKLKACAPNARKVATACLKGYQLSFNKQSTDGSGKGNVIQTNNPDDLVWGVVFEISEEEANALDKEEKGYLNVPLVVTTVDNNEQVTCYIADEIHINNELIPYDWYKEMIVRGAAENDLPIEYQTYLQNITAAVDIDEKRTARKMKILNKI